MLNNIRSGRSRFAPRRAQALLEFCLVGSIFLIPFTLGIMQFGLLTSDSNYLTQLARDGAREAGKVGISDPGYAAGNTVQNYLKVDCASTPLSFSAITPVFTCSNNGTTGACSTTASPPTQISGGTVTLKLSYNMSKIISPVWLGFGFFSGTVTKSATFVIEK